MARQIERAVYPLQPFTGHSAKFQSLWNPLLLAIGGRAGASVAEMALGLLLAARLHVWMCVFVCVFYTQCWQVEKC